MRAGRESQWRTFAAKLRGFLSRQQRDDGFDDEIQEHVRLLADRFVAQGMSREEAARAARRQFGNTTLLQEERRTLQTLPSIEAWGHDLRYAARILKARPGFAVAAAVTLALGIGSNAAIFTVINAVLLRPLPFVHSEQLHAVSTRFLPPSGLDFPYFAVSGPEFADIRSRVDAFAGIAAYNMLERNVAHDKREPERMQTMRVTPGLFDVLGVRPIRGRTFTEEEARSGSCLALLPDDGSETAVTAIGSTIRLDEIPCEVIGVMPTGFVFRDNRVKVWTALNTEESTAPRGRHVMMGIARLRDGVTGEQVDAQLQSLRQYWSETYPDHHAKGHFAVSRPLHEDIVGDQRDAWVLLGGAVLFVLLIVSVNVAALLISKGEARRREFAVRGALGANRRRLMRQLVVEAMLLAAAGGLMGVVLAKWLLEGLLVLYPERLPVSQAITIDYSAVLYTCALVIVVGVLIGLVPALHATGVRMQDALKTDSRTGTSSRSVVAARSVLVISQLAVSVILLVGAVFLIRSYQRLQQVDLGMESDRMLTFTINIPRARQEDAAAIRTLEAIEDRLAAIPGVEAVGATSALPPAAAGALLGFKIEGRTEPPPDAIGWSARYLTATPQIFRALGIPLKRGRLLAESDVAGRPPVAVINETLARLYWPGDDPVGRTIRYYPQETNASIQIVGIVGDVRSRGANEPAPPAVYVPLAQSPPFPAFLGRFSTFVVRTLGSPADIAASVRAAVTSVDAGLPLANLRPLSEVVSASSGQPRFTTLVMSSFAGMAFLLAALGLYGTLAYGVEQRIREIGIRIALGAGRREILRLIVGSGMGLALVGVLVGIPAALALRRLVTGVLPAVANNDPTTYIAVVAMLSAVAFLASYLAARRAMRIDPLVALRTD